jgi:RNA polymerase sigma factor (sigma-70 family)
VDRFDALYRQYREPVLGYFARRVSEPEAAADLMAETFARALEQSRRGWPRSPSAWLFTIARNLLIDSVRRGQVEASARRRLRLEPLVLDDVDMLRVAEIAQAADLAQLLREQLTQEAYAALVARAVDDEPYERMAVRLRCSQAVVRKRVSRAAAHARATLGEVDV